MTSITAHIINHTHWDREWFLTSVYTTPWIAGLVDRLVALVEQNPGFHYLLDGQTLVIEDLLGFAPHYRPKVDRLIRAGNLAIGPYYCQPDWRLTGGEALLRNLLYGRQDMQQYQVATDTGWLVDTFGHISQAPQLHHLFGIHSVYVWRGAPQMEPYFFWCGADGSRLFTINLFGGYRNLYGVTHAPEIAARRLQAEIQKLRPYYPTPDIPLFDGYDLEDNPEDPLQFYLSPAAEMPPEIQVREATPASFAPEISQKLHDIPTITGELNSGKYGAVFPGTLSTRTYLKVIGRDCEHLLYQVCEPLGVLARLMGRTYPAEQYQAWSRVLLQNSVHDCICGVSIDQVHEKMEFSYRQVFEALQGDLDTSLAYILNDFAPGMYALSTNPYTYEGWLAAGDGMYQVQTEGIGVWPAGEHKPITASGQPLETFAWQNRYYTGQVLSDGRVQVGEAVLGSLRVYEERGDTYSEESGPFLGDLKVDGPMLIEQESEAHCVLRIVSKASWGEIQVSAVLRLTFDQSPLIRWQIELDSRGTDFRVDLDFDFRKPAAVYAGMPFDTVRRATVDQDLLPRQLEEDLAAVLLGQRELGAVRTFPFHDFVALSDGLSSAAVLAKGLHAYRADESGCLTFPLRRSVEWLTKPNLEGRVGDAGPFFYVPDARCERSVTHELAAMFVDCGVDDPQFQALNAGFQNPPLLVEAQTAGWRTRWGFFQEDIPTASLHIADDRVLARIYNPDSSPHRLSKDYLQTGVSGGPERTVREVLPKSILTLDLGELPARQVGQAGSPVQLFNAPAWRVGSNQGLPDPAIIRQLQAKVTRLEAQIEAAEAKLAQAAGRERYICQRQVYVFQRELLEYRLSARLNEIKLAMRGQVTEAYLYQPDEEIAVIGRLLNQLRIKRRIYDYIVQAV